MKNNYDKECEYDIDAFPAQTDSWEIIIENQTYDFKNNNNTNGGENAYRELHKRNTKRS